MGITRVHLSFSPCLLCPCLAGPCSQTQFFPNSLDSCIVATVSSPCWPLENFILSAETSEPVAAPAPLLGQCLGCAVMSLCTEPSFFTPFFHPPRPVCLPPLSCWPPEGSAPHCHECSILVGNKWIQQIISGTGFQCGEKMFPGAP